MEANSEHLAIPSTPTRLLLVDDKPQNLLALEKLLAAPQYQFVMAHSGRAALSTLLDDQEFALILMDVQMPGMDGFETAQLIRESEKTRDIPIIFITAAYTTVEDTLQGYRLHAIDYILKPIDPKILRTKVEVVASLYPSRRRLEAEISWRKQLQQDLMTSNRDLEQFAYAISHDLKEPLRTSSGFLGLLKKNYQGKLDEQADEYIDYAVSGMKHMSEMIDGLLAYSRLSTQARAFEPVDLERVVQQVLVGLKVQIEESHSEIQCEKLPTLKGDAIQLEQLFQNLIANAIKFRSDEAPRIHISATQEHDCWHIRVSDNGIGIDPRFQERIFRVFQRLHAAEQYPGLGIGLALCRRIVERHEGKIEVDSNEPVGSVFTICLPA